MSAHDEVIRQRAVLAIDDLRRQLNLQDVEASRREVRFDGEVDHLSGRGDRVGRLLVRVSICRGERCIRERKLLGWRLGTGWTAEKAAH
jgi:hypothetical protein